MAGRNEEFSYGMSGGPMIATSLQQHVNPAFSPSSVLAMYQNTPSGTGQDPRVTGAMRVKDFGITQANTAPGSEVINV
jgi:hypothetical protein